MIMTVALLLDTPHIVVYTDMYKVHTLMSTFTSMFMIPWLACETMAGQLLVFTVLYLNYNIGLHTHFSWEFNFIYSIPCYIFYGFANVVLINEIFVGQKTVIRNTMQLQRQYDEFDTILSSLPQGILLTKMKTRDEVAAKPNNDSEKQVLPFSPLFVNSSLK